MKKERNELAKQLFIHNTDMTPLAACNAADDMMAQLYGLHWEDGDDAAEANADADNKSNVDPTTQPTSVITKDGISIYADNDGNKFVRVKVLDEDFLIEPHDLDGGKEFEWKEAMERLKKLGKTTFTKKQTHIICAFIDEINSKMEEIGGEKLTSFYWTSTEYGAAYAWYVSFNNGGVTNYYKCSSYVVRACAAFKN